MGIVQHHFQTHGRKKLVPEICQVRRRSPHIAHSDLSTRRELKRTEADRLVEDILVELFLSPESARLDFTLSDQGGADAWHVQRGLIKSDGTAGTSVESCGDHCVT